MTISNNRQQLAKYISEKEGGEYQTQLAKVIERVRGKPFWLDVDSETHKQSFKDSKGNCCYWHQVGEPTREINGKTIRTACFDYQLSIIKDLESIRRICINKSTSTGITELLTVRWLAWKCLSSDEWQGQTVAILNAPRLNMSVNIINRIKNLFPSVTFKERETKIVLNSCVVEAFPSHLGLAAMRGIDRLACCILEEFDWFNSLEEQISARNIAERNIGKNNSYIIAVSTPNRPDFELAKLERENGSGIYKFIRLPYDVALGKMFDDNFIQEAMKTPGFQQEYNLKFQGHVGNLLSPESIDKCITNYDIETINHDSVKCAGLDPGFGSSNMALVVTEYVQSPVEKIRVIYENQWNRPNFIQVLNEIWYDVLQPYGVKHVKIDGSNVAVVDHLMKLYKDDTYPSYSEAIKRLEARHCRVEDNYHVEPISFQKDGRELLSNMKMVIDRNKLEIHPSMTALITGLRSAVTDDRFGLDKTKSLETHLVDAARCNLKFYKFR